MKMKLVQELEWDGDSKERSPGWYPTKFQTWINLESITRLREGDGHTDVLFQCGKVCCEIYVTGSARELLE